MSHDGLMRVELDLEGLPEDALRDLITKAHGILQKKIFKRMEQSAQAAAEGAAAVPQLPLCQLRQKPSRRSQRWLTCSHPRSRSRPTTPLHPRKQRYQNPCQSPSLPRQSPSPPRKCRSLVKTCHHRRRPRPRVRRRRLLHLQRKTQARRRPSQWIRRAAFILLKKRKRSRLPISRALGRRMVRAGRGHAANAVRIITGAMGA